MIKLAVKRWKFDERSKIPIWNQILVCDSISSNSCKFGGDLSSLDVKRLHRRTLGEAHWAVDEAHRADGEVHRRAEEGI